MLNITKQFQLTTLIHYITTICQHITVLTLTTYITLLLPSSTATQGIPLICQFQTHRKRCKILIAHLRYPQQANSLISLPHPPKTAFSSRTTINNPNPPNSPLIKSTHFLQTSPNPPQTPTKYLLNCSNHQSSSNQHQYQPTQSFNSIVNLSNL
jgi:hypothetical protein